MTPQHLHLQAIADSIRRWERADGCVLSLMLVGISDEVGRRRLIHYWIRDGHRLVMDYGRKLRYCADDVAEIMPGAGLQEILICRPSTDLQSHLSIWRIDVRGVKGYAQQVTPAAMDARPAEGVTA